MTLTSDSLIDMFNHHSRVRWNTVLVGGFSEPLYLPADGGRPAEIRFTRNYVRSALHELSHWCIAGESRRNQVDYGYWYRPDGRNHSEQEEFFKVEVKPQALERAFSEAYGIPFEVSCDNLGGVAIDARVFDSAVAQQCADFKRTGFPPRAEAVLRIIETMIFSQRNGDALLASSGT